MNSSPVVFGMNNNIVGVLKIPTDNDINDHGIILLNAGMLHKIGPNRLFYKISKVLCKNGFVSLRFDFEGIGDSLASDSTDSFEEVSIENIRYAMKYLQTKKNISKFILVGLCTGGNAAFNYAVIDDRINGLILINSNEDFEDIGIRDKIEKKTTIRYYKKKLLSTLKLIDIVKNINASKVKKIGCTIITNRGIPSVPYKNEGKQEKKGKMTNERSIIQNWHHLIGRNVSIMKIYSEGSSSYDVYNSILKKYYKTIFRKSSVNFVFLKNIDHVFTPLWAQNKLEEIIVEWITKKYKY